ncbi:L-2-amino-4-chloropent-4-enoate dechlorinase/desaturase [Frankia sp. AiPs1]|uniref:PLP-dependent transferase n=1 Tax=Frankia sp. AiPa1 TaxID=573492 RepID=UPI00202B3719|nr:PLP-dependent transferase [Frankia sp. AiPa1]MCL9759635.1 PLP-dependent transferase [Frankia sp. AiPa1]
MADVIGFESDDERTLRHVTSGYPRFRTHRYVTELTHVLSHILNVPARELVLVRTARAAAAACAYGGSSACRTVFAVGVNGVTIAGGPVANRRVREFVKHTGCHLSSREAEDALVRCGELSAHDDELLAPDGAEDAISVHLARVYGAGHADNVILHNSGMNAVAAALAAVAKIQRGRGRRRWLQLGWIFFDTMSIFEKRIVDADRIIIPDPGDTDAIVAAVLENADDLAGIIGEVPSNPLLQTPDVEAVREIADRVGCLVVLDTTIGTPHNIDVLAHADVACESLTKYATGSADVLMGATIVNPSSAFADEIRPGLREYGDRPFGRDAARAASRISGYAARIERVNRSTMILAEFLESQSNVRGVEWAYSDRSARNYSKIHRSASSPGGLLLLDLKVPIEQVYDPLPIPKGPSFGADFTMASPQVFIAHNDMLSTVVGREELRRRGLHRDMLRISMGIEDPDPLIDSLRQVLATPISRAERTTKTPSTSSASRFPPL